MPVIERQGNTTVPVTRMWPAIRGGVCEYCGIIDNNQPAEVQYTLCPHFSSMGEIACSYCDASTDMVEVIKKGVLLVHGKPGDPDTLVVVCDKTSCADKHIKKYQANA